jgi:hypothetical protein
LLDDKHDLEFQLKKSVETSKQQIDELEQTIEILNMQIKISKGTTSSSFCFFVFSKQFFFNNEFRRA